MNPSNASDLERLQADYPELREALDSRRRVHEEVPSSPDAGGDLTAGADYAAILERERDAQVHLRRTADQLHDLLADPAVEIDPRLPEMLEQCARLGEQVIRWLGELVELSGRIESLGDDAPPDRVRPLRELREKFIEKVKTLSDTSRSLEERAFALTSGPGPDEATGTEVLEVEFEDFDEKLRSLAMERDRALTRLASAEARLEAETGRREKLERRLAELEARFDEERKALLSRIEAVKAERDRADPRRADDRRRLRDLFGGGS